MGKHIADLKVHISPTPPCTERACCNIFVARKEHPIDVRRSCDIQIYASPSKHPRHRVLSNQIFSFNPLSI